MSYKSKYKNENTGRDYIYVIENEYYEFPVKLSNVDIIIQEYQNYIKQDNIFSNLTFEQFWNSRHSHMPITRYNGERINLIK